MKHLKLFEDFSLTQEGSITFSEAEEIFFPMNDYELYTSDVYVSNFLSLGDKDVIENHTELTGPLHPGVAVRLNNKGIIITDNFFNDLQDCISHFESRCECKISSIYLRMPGGYWFKNVESLEKHIKEWENTVRYSVWGNAFKLLSNIDLVFKFDDSIKTFWTTSEDGNLRSVHNRKS